MPASWIWAQRRSNLFLLISSWISFALLNNCWSRFLLWILMRDSTASLISLQFASSSLAWPLNCSYLLTWYDRETRSFWYLVRADSETDRSRTTSQVVRGKPVSCNNIIIYLWERECQIFQLNNLFWKTQIVNQIKREESVDWDM